MGFAREVEWNVRLAGMSKLALLGLLLWFSPWLNAANLFEADPSTYRSLLKKLGPGDTLLLHPGEYLDGLPIHNINGEAGKPITITGPETGVPPQLLARAGHNTISILDASYVVIRNLALDGRNMPVDGVKAEGHAEWAHHITLENLVIRGHGNNQQTVGISTKCPTWDWIIKDNIIIGAGTGIYLGNSDGSDPFIGGLIEHNLIVDSLGYNLQIKHQIARPTLPGIPSGKRVTIVRHNVFSKARGGSSTAARPNMLVGHWPLTGMGAEDVYEIYGNFYYENPHEALFQGEGNIALHNNLFVNHHGDAVRIQPHNDIPRKVDVFYNTVVSSGVGIAIRNREEDPPYPQTVAANTVFAATPIIGGVQETNLTAPYGTAASFLGNPFGPLGEMDLYPRQGKKISDSVTATPCAACLDWDKDFNGKRRNLRFRGAYSGSGTNPGWLPRLERKPRF